MRHGHEAFLRELAQKKAIPIAIGGLLKAARDGQVTPTNSALHEYFLQKLEAQCEKNGKMPLEISCDIFEELLIFVGEITVENLIDEVKEIQKIKSSVSCINEVLNEKPLKPRPKKP